ncbi:BED finger-nbs-lrr resistance-like protein [Theobroma cacao]|uniref:BED finger-nbs-lrr resistance-like protein n=1 Tax=Theobroma cacao TaxID=3641 RepID=A0A061F731_THECC|nr:BED finger-nbs-lrr resistance-like protein [Theobroma cacao]
MAVPLCQVQRVLTRFSHGISLADAAVLEAKCAALVTELSNSEFYEENLTNIQELRRNWIVCRVHWAGFKGTFLGVAVDGPPANGVTLLTPNLVTMLKDILEEKSYVLIFDDVWKWLSLLEVGIFEPTLGMGRKVAFTSRSIEVCKSMGCKVVVEVQLLSKKKVTTYDLEKGVKMHDVLRDMAYYIKGHQFMVKDGMQLEELPSVEKVSLMQNPRQKLILEIPPHISPKCPHLSTLLSQNCGLRRILEVFFKHMSRFKVLNISRDYEIEDLPNSISNLENLNALILSYYKMLKYAPSLAKLKALRKLDISYTEIEEVPHGIEKLEYLRYLDPRGNLVEILVGILPMMSHIQCLIGDWLHLRGEEVGKLRKLEFVSCMFCDMQEFKKYGESIQVKKEVRLGECKREWCDDIVLPNDLHTLMILKFDDLKCLCNIPWFRKAIDLKFSPISLNSCMSRSKEDPFVSSLVENAKPSPPPSLKGIYLTSRKWWESVEWDQPNAKDVFSPFVVIPEW